MRPLTWDDLGRGLQSRISRAEFARRSAAAEGDMAKREREGESDALIYYVLQSRSFTRLPPIEPAVSAREFASSMAVEERECYLSGQCPDAGNLPQNAHARIEALRHPSVKSADGISLRDGRASYFRTLLQDVDVNAEYRRAMRFLYLKEFAGSKAPYQSRGLSTDTSLAPNYTVWNALAVLHSVDPAFRVRRALIIGPGLDMASRTELIENAEPQSYQPYLTANALHQLGVSEAVQIDCLDLNQKVVEFINRFSAKQSAVSNRTLQFPLNDIAEAEPAYREWRHGLGARFVVPSGIAENVHAAKGNVLTERPDAVYDLVVATNVLLYFNDEQLELAIGSIASMLRENGYLIHNELRPALDEIGSASALKAVAGRTLRIAPGLLDVFAIHRKGGDATIAPWRSR